MEKKMFLAYLMSLGYVEEEGGNISSFAPEVEDGEQVYIVSYTSSTMDRPQEVKVLNSDLLSFIFDKVNSDTPIRNN